METMIDMKKLMMDNEVEQLVEMIRSVKEDQTTLKLQQQFYQDSKNPLQA